MNADLVRRMFVNNRVRPAQLQPKVTRRLLLTQSEALHHSYFYTVSVSNKIKHSIRSHGSEPAIHYHRYQHYRKRSQKYQPRLSSYLELVSSYVLFAEQQTHSLAHHSVSVSFRQSLGAVHLKHRNHGQCSTIFIFFDTLAIPYHPLT